VFRESDHELTLYLNKKIEHDSVMIVSRGIGELIQLNIYDSIKYLYVGFSDNRNFRILWKVREYLLKD